MGGYGSGRWGWHRKKTAVESCLKIKIKDLGELKNDSREISLAYTITPRTGGYTVAPARGGPEDLTYSIRLTWTPTPWGARRWWFICPLAGCGKRAAILYLPPGGRYFGCRTCYNLTYKSSQESHSMDSLCRFLARSGIASPDEARETCEILQWESTGKMSPWLAARLDSRIEQRFGELLSFDPYGDYLAPGELCEQSGLTPESLAALESCRLLVPDHAGKYRPKLAGWGRKLAYLLSEGWSLDELKAWARGRWSTPNPREWPPERAAWAE